MSRLLATFRKRALERDLEDEVQAHLEMLAAENIRRGMDPDSARRAARRSFGAIGPMKEVYREWRGVAWIETFWQDLRYALRALRKSPGFAAVAILTLALGIGANTAIFSVIEAVLLRPLPYREPARLMLLADSPDGECLYKDFKAWRSQSQSFEDMALFYKNSGISRVTLTGTSEPEAVQGGFVSANVFPLMGVRPLLGRTFTAEEETRRVRVLVLSHSLWTRRFGASADVLGRTLEMDGISWQVIGVMPEAFQFPGRRTQFWAPITTNRLWGDPELLGNNPGKTRGFYARWSVLARLRPGVTPAAALSEMKTIGARLAKADPDPHRGDGAHVTPLRVNLAGNTRLALLILFGAVLFVLLIACSNVANLVLARGAAREREIALRTALGAGRGRLIRQLFTESIVLASLAGLLALGLAGFGIRALVTFAPPDIPRLEQAGVNAGVLAFTLVASFFAALLFGLAPACKTSQGSPYTSLKQPVTARALLVVAEFALSVVLLTGAGLLVRSFLAVQAVDLGFRPEHVLTLHMGWPARTPESRQLAFQEQALQAMRALPGVQAAGAIDVLFELGSGLNLLGLRAIEGRELRETREHWTELIWKTVGGDYFQTIGATLVSGRFFSAEDGPGSPLVAIIDESMARRYWPGEDPLGQRIKGQDRRRKNDEWVTIVGVVRDMRRHGKEKNATPHVFESVRQSNEFLPDLVVRTVGDPQALAATLRSEIRSLDRTVILSQVTTLEQQLSDQLSPRRFQTWLLGLLSVLALALATIGIYGVMHYAVAQRTHEIGIRMALGAETGSVVRMVLRQGLSLALAGVAAGVAGAWYMTQLLRNLLFGVKPDDPVTFGFVCFVLLGVALLASLIPAWRAARVDPLTALRHE